MIGQSPSTRRLAAILVSDVVGYSRMMGKDEAATVAAILDLRRTIVDPALAQHNGRLIKVMGDGAIAEFGSVVDAVTCAVKVQRETALANADLPEDRQVRLRIGINLGDLVVDGDDLLGDGVNVAARLESIAEPGGIFVARNVANMVRGKVPFGFVDLGEKHLKNIAQPVQVFRVDPDGATATHVPPVRRPAGRTVRLGAFAAALIVLLVAGWTFLYPTSAPAIDASTVLKVKGPAVAALPFRNLSGEAEHDAFAQGMTEQVAAALTRFKGLRVLSRRASAKYADDLDALRSNLGADYLLEGNVRRDEDRVRVTALLTDVKTGDQIWTDTFDAALTPANILDVQDRLAGQVVSAIASGPNSAIQLERLADRQGTQTDDMAALDCAYDALFWTTPKQLFETIDCLKAAVDRDPAYADGWSRLSNQYAVDYFFQYQYRADPGYSPLELALESAETAVRLSPNDSFAHRQLAFAHFGLGNMTEFRSEATKAMELNPNDANGIAEIGMRLAFSGHWDEGAALIGKAEAFNPSVLEPAIFYGTAKGMYVRGEYAEALTELKKGYFPGSLFDALIRIYVNADWGMMDAAQEALNDLEKIAPGFSIEDAVGIYRRWRFTEDYIAKMTADLRKAGLRETRATATN